jgi:hypothetical protein
VSPPARGDAVAPLQVLGVRHLGASPCRAAPLRDLGQRGAGARFGEREAIDFGVAAVARDKPLIAIEEAQPLLHLVDCDFEEAALIVHSNAFRQCFLPARDRAKLPYARHVANP